MQGPPNAARSNTAGTPFAGKAAQPDGCSGPHDEFAAARKHGGLSPYDAAGMDQAPPGYSSVGSSGAPPSLSPLSPVLPLGCASVLGSGLSVWLRFGWDPGGAVVMRGCKQRSAAACA